MSVSLKFSQITNDFLAPGRDAEHWGTTDWDGKSTPQVPAGNSTPMNFYQRFVWGQIETSQGVYNFADFDNYVNQAIREGGQFSFGIMIMCTACSLMPTYGYPTYAHNIMQGESVPDWKDKEGDWVPNWNSQAGLLIPFSNLLKALANHINTSSYNGVAYKNVIYYVDVRGYGDFGEWHTYPFTDEQPKGAVATSATLKAIVDAHIAAFPNYQLIIPMGAFDTDPGHSSRMPADFAYYALTASNSFGELGWRRDNYGDPQYNDWLTDGGGSYNGIPFTPLIMNKWQKAHIGGEPNNGLAAVSTCGSPYCDILNEVNLFHVSSFGNGNYPLPASSSPIFVSNILAAFKATGYRLILVSGIVDNIVNPGGLFDISLVWQNIGIAPVYQNWEVDFELRLGQSIVWSSKSSFTPRLFLPSNTATGISDGFTLPSNIKAGVYGLYLIVRDPLGYKKPLPLGIAGQQTDGSYLLSSSITVQSGTGTSTSSTSTTSTTTKIPPKTTSTTSTTSTSTSSTTTQAPPSGQVTIFNNVIPSGVSLGNDNQGGIETGVKFISSIAGYITGISFYKTSGNKGNHIGEIYDSKANRLASANFVNETTTGWQTVLFPSPVAIQANTLYIASYFSSLGNYTNNGNYGLQKAVTNKNLTALADGTQGVNGVYVYSNSPKFPSSSYQKTNYWVDVIFQSGNIPPSSTTTTTTSSTSTTSTTTKKPNTPPTANAGPDQSQTLPPVTIDVLLDGSSSSDNDGTIVSFLWTKVNGPLGDSIVNPTKAQTVVTGLVKGAYVYKLTVTDNNNLSGTDSVTVIIS